MTPFLNYLLASLEQLEEHPYHWNDPGKLDLIKRMLKQAPDQLRNRHSPLHLSASAMVFTKNLGIFIRHPYLHTTLLPAGHVEPHELPVNCAVREFHEETGYQVDSTKRRLIDINIIDIPANPLKGEGAHKHVDFRYWFDLIDQSRNSAELPVYFLAKSAAPDEFKPYFELTSVDPEQLDSRD